MKKYQLTAPSGRSADYKEELNAQQLAAVTAGDGAVLIVAGAGSGKTRALTYRVAYLIDKGVRPREIVLCTFTNKAAREMLARVEHLVSVRARDVRGGTFHHLANTILRSYASLLGYTPGFGILDAEDARDLMSSVAADVTKKSSVMLPRPTVLTGLVSLASNTLTPLDQVVLDNVPSLVNRMDEVLQIARTYRQRKIDMNMMDFDDLLTNLYTLLTSYEREAREVAKDIRHVLVDEYQDTNPIQAEIVDGLAAVSRNLTVVGDDAQSIYSFRGATPENMLNFQDRWPESRAYKLEVNYRSTPQILAMANESIALNPEQFPKKLTATRPDGPKPALVTVRDVEDQAAFIAQRVLELSQETYDLREMAVLYRAHHHSLELQVELTRREIPYTVRSGVRFFEQAHIKDILAYLRLVENPYDEISWIRVLKLQPGIGRTSSARIFADLKKSGDPIEKALSLKPDKLHSRGQAGWSNFQNSLKKMMDDKIRSDSAALIRTVLDTGYLDLLPALYSNASSRLEDIEQLERYSEHYPDPNSFLSELHLLSEFGSEQVQEGRGPEDHLVLSTVHQAKGLEWKVVFIIGLNEGAFPHPRSLKEKGGETEERRLFYVAATRTMDELYMVCPLAADRRGHRRVVQKPSRFVNEVDLEDLVEHWTVESY